MSYEPEERHESLGCLGVLGLVAFALALWAGIIAFVKWVIP